MASTEKNKIVLHVINAFMAGGAETLICRLAPLQLSYGYQPIIVSLGGFIDDVGKGLIADLQDYGIDYIVLDKLAMSERLKTVKRCVNLIHQYKPDIVHTHCDTPDLYGGIASIIAGKVQHISTVHSTQFDSRLLAKVVRFIVDLLGKPHYIAVCGAVALVIEEQLGIPKNRIDIIPNGVDTKRFLRDFNRELVRRNVFKTKGDGKIIVSIGRLAKEKNYRCLLKAFAILVREYSNLSLCIFGEGRERQCLEAEIDNLGLSELVDLPGITDDVPAILRSADLFVLPSSWEGLPLAAIEAMMAGMPVVVSNVGGLNELAQRDAPVLTFPSGDAQTLADKIKQFLESPELMSKLGQSAQKWAMQNYSLETMVEGYASLYNRLLNL